jgi:haloacetate dehalogenase
MAAKRRSIDFFRILLDRKVECPLLVLWGEKGFMPHYDVIAAWQERAMNVRGKALPGGHWLPEQLPAETLAELIPFLSEA